MKFLWIMAVAVALVASDDEVREKNSKKESSPAKDATEGRSSSKPGDAQGNTRFFGGLLGGRPNRPVGGFPNRPVGGFPNRPVGGVVVNPGVGGSFGVNAGLNPGFGGPGFGGSFGVQPGFGNVNPGFGGGFGTVNPGFGGGFGTVNPGFGGGFVAVNPGLNSGFNAVAPPSSCRRWCRTPQGQAYCCESAHQPESLAALKPGFCPPVRPVCPPTRSFAPPASCSSDGGCGGVDKCCFDTCLQQHTCKPPQGFGR